MEFEAFKNTIMDLVSKEVEDRGLEGISMKLTTVESPDGMTDRLMDVNGFQAQGNLPERRRW